MANFKEDPLTTTKTNDYDVANFKNFGLYFWDAFDYTLHQGLAKAKG